MANVEALDGIRIANHTIRLVEFVPATFTEQHHFKISLESAGRRADRPVFHGLASAGRASQHVPGWIDGFFGGVAYFDGERVDLADDDLDRALMRKVGHVIAPGGWLGLAYETLGEDTDLLQETRRLLNRAAPPIVTPLGMLLHAAGCGYHIRNWYISEGWREGARKLQGYRPSHEESRREHARRTAEALREFLDGSKPSGELAGARDRAVQLLQEIEG